MADLTNVERNRAGLGALTVNARLNTAAQLQADQVASLQLLAHEVANGRYPTPSDRLTAARYQWQASGENLASGYRTVAEAMDGWMNSPGHRANNLSTLPSPRSERRTRPIPPVCRTTCRYLAGPADFRHFSTSAHEPPTINYQLAGYNAALPSMLPVSAYRIGVACGSSTSPATTRATTTM